MSVKVTADALSEAIDYFTRFPDVANKAASLAINQVARREGLRTAQDAIYEQVAFPRDYLKGDRLTVSKLANPNDLSAVIVGRKRATSLARFAKGVVGGGTFTPGGGRQQNLGATVRVKTAGGGKALRGAWLVRLRRGASLDEDNYNVGLAVRVKPGETINGKKTEHQSWLVKPDDKHGGVALLYGPSVDQVFRDVADQIAPMIGQQVATEFYRQFARLA